MEKGRFLSKKIDRRELFRDGAKAGLGAGTALLIGCGDGPDKEFTVESTIASTPLEVAVQNLRNKGVRESLEERKTWSFAPLVKLRQNATQQESEVAIANSMSLLLERMRRSENPNFNESALLWESLNAQGRIDFSTQVPVDILMATGIEFDENTLSYKFGLNVSEDVFTKYSDIEAALILSHESQHLRDNIALMDGFKAANMTWAEIKSNTAIVKSDPNFCAQNETVAYAYEANTYLYLKALIPAITLKDTEEVAIAYVAAGQDATSTEFQSFVVNDFGGCKR